MLPQLLDIQCPVSRCPALAATLGFLALPQLFAGIVGYVQASNRMTYSMSRAGEWHGT